MFVIEQSVHHLSIDPIRVILYAVYQLSLTAQYTSCRYDGCIKLTAGLAHKNGDGEKYLQALSFYVTDMMWAK